MTQAMQFLEEAGCSQSAIIDSALTLFIPWQKSKEEQYQVVSERISAALLDPTVSSLVCAACFLALSKKYTQDNEADEPNALKCTKSGVSDLSGSYLGMAVAEHLAGTYAYFEYMRYLKSSPGIIGEIKDPYISHILAGLIAGVTSRLYSEGW
jgi:phosphatidylglycerophosphatase A